MNKRVRIRANETNEAKQQRAVAIIQFLRKATQGMNPPASTLIVDRYGRDPYLILIACILSLRTKDTVSEPAARRLFGGAKTPQQMVQLPALTIEKLIYPVGFYHQKTRHILTLSKQLIEQYQGIVPADEKSLLSLAGVGRKTANLVQGQAFNIPALCVDTHVHRISNRLGLVSTKTPRETEEALKNILPPDYWIEYNTLLVIWGQNICVPISPLCSQCAIASLCPRVGVTRSR